MAKSTTKVRPDKSSLINLLEDIQKGEIKIPLFQRDFVWTGTQMKALFDSLRNGYPMGSLLFWIPEEEYKSNENFGPYKIDKKSKQIRYVLDGFQRLSTLFGVLTKPKDYEKSYEDACLKQYAIYYDLEEEEFTYIKRGQLATHLIPLYVLIDTFEFLDFSEELRNKTLDKEKSNEWIGRAKSVAKKIIDYEVPFTEIYGGDIQGAVEIFSRLNSTGTQISQDWMLSALSYIPDKFLLSDEITNLTNDLGILNFGDLDRDTILHCIESASDKLYFDVKAEDLAREESFAELVTLTKKNISKAVEFFRYKLNLIEYKLLPYNLQLIFLTEFFRLNSNPNEEEQQQLIDWFWITSYSNYFTTSLSQQRKAFNHFKDFAKKKKTTPVYNHNPSQAFVTASLPDKVNFGSVRSKSTVLFLLNNAIKNNETTNYPNVDIRYLSLKHKSIASAVVGRDREFPKDRPKNDGSFLLEEYTEEYEKFFITPEMVALSQQGKIAQALELRGILIQQAEQQFVSDLGLEYGSGEE